MHEQPQDASKRRADLVPSVRNLEMVLWHHVLEPWFPRCIDREHGGFLCDFDYAWRDVGPHHKLIEFQARQTLAAALAARRYPAATALREAALHGFHALAEIMWDRAEGGWFHCTDRAGRPFARTTKHTHGFAYAIPACLAVHALTGDARALSLAKEAFLWLDRHAHDQAHGGYLGFMERSGRPILAPSDKWTSPVDVIGTPLGCKDANVLTDMVECLTPLAAAWPEGPAANRLAELFDILVDKTVAADGTLHFCWTRDWRPRAAPERIGYYLQGANGLVEASPSLRVRATARLMLERAFVAGWDARGGFFEIGPADQRRSVPGRPANTIKTWWQQWEGLAALASFGDDDWENRDRDRFGRLWAYIGDQLLDETHRGGGWFCRDSGLAALGCAPPFASTAQSPKGTMWKDGSHEARSLLYCIERFEEREAHAGAAAAGAHGD